LVLFEKGKSMTPLWINTGNRFQLMLMVGYPTISQVSDKYIYY
jgi:hypothetical protein